MSARTHRHSAVKWIVGVAGVASAAYVAHFGRTWYRYGRAARPSPGEEDSLLDRFMPSYEVVERHRIVVRAPASVTLAVARDVDLSQSPLVRAIFKGRELILGADPDERHRPHGLLADVQSLGWVVLAELPDREIVVGAATRPWQPNVTFRSVPADQFAAFAEPDYVKIAWTLRADPAGDNQSIFRTETRAMATDGAARAKFRRYWSFLSPGISLIRRALLAPVKAEAERRAGA